MLRRTVLLGLLAAALVPASANAAVQLVKVGTFSTPTYVTAPPGDTQRLFVVEQAGRIQVMVGTQKQTTPFLDITSQVGYDHVERGLLSMAFAPDYATSGTFYVDYVDTAGNLRVDKLQRSPSNPNVAAPGQQNLLTIPHPNHSNHNGGQLQFGPDGYLYISTGDGGGSDDVEHNAQDTSSLLGKILRINPADPSASVPGNIPNTRIYAYGLRNPWRFSFDRLTGDMIIGDVGQSAREEIDFAHPGDNAGANYGWPCYEGAELNTDDSVQTTYPECSTTTNPSLASAVPPVHEYNHSGSGFTGYGIIGGYVVRDPSLTDLYGRYVYGDLSTSGTKGLRSITLPAANDDQSVPVNVAGLSSFGEDAVGCVYAASQGNGGVWRLAPDTNPTPGPCGNGGPGSGPAKDTTAPSLSLRRRKRQRVLRTHSIRIGAVANELAAFSATATVRVPKTAVTLRFKRTTRKSVAAGKRVTLKLRLTKSTLRKLRRAMSHNRSRIARVTVTARDGSGNARTRRLTVRLVH